MKAATIICQKGKSKILYSIRSKETNSVEEETLSLVIFYS